MHSIPRYYVSVASNLGQYRSGKRSIGPASYVVNASDLKAVTAGNVLCTYADDTYAIIPSDNVHTRTAELDNLKA